MIFCSTSRLLFLRLPARFLFSSFFLVDPTADYGEPTTFYISQIFFFNIASLLSSYLHGHLFAPHMYRKPQMATLSQLWAKCELFFLEPEVTLKRRLPKKHLAAKHPFTFETLHFGHHVFKGIRLTHSSFHTVTWHFNVLSII